MAGSAAPVGHLREGTTKDRLASPGRSGRGCSQGAVRVQVRIGQKVEFVHVGNDPVKKNRVGFGTVELIDDDVAYELPQRREPTVAPVGRGEADPPQIGDVKRVEMPIVRMAGEKIVAYVHAAGTAG